MRDLDHENVPFPPQDDDLQDLIAQEFEHNFVEAWQEQAYLGECHPKPLPPTGRKS